MKLRLDRWRRCRGQLLDGPERDRETLVASATCLTNLSGHPVRPAGSSALKPSSTRFTPVHCHLFAFLLMIVCCTCKNIKSPMDCQILQDDLNYLAQWETDWQTKFNVAKCHSMRVTQHLPENQIRFKCSLHQHKLEQVQSAKYLGITITDNLNWGQHVSEISCKATKTMGFLRRNLALALRHTKEVAYKTLVRSQLEYAAPIWNPYHETQIAQVEKVQRTAARWTCRRWRNTSSVGDMLDELEWPSLEARREQSSLAFFYKIHSGTVSLDKDKYLTPAPNLRIARASHESQYTRYLAYSEALKNSFFPRTIPVWNSLPSSVVSSKTPEEFMALI